MGAPPDSARVRAWQRLHENFNDKVNEAKVDLEHLRDALDGLLEESNDIEVRGDFACDLINFLNDDHDRDKLSDAIEDIYQTLEPLWR